MSRKFWEDHQKDAEQIVAAARKLPYFGELPVGKTWGSIIGHHRDSDTLEESNFWVVSKDLEERFPEDVEIVRFGHFGVGWIEELMVRFLDKKGKITAAGKAALEWAYEIDDYPVADEDDYTQRQVDAGEI